MSRPESLELFVSCPGGVEPLLEAELRALFPRGLLEPLRGGVAVHKAPAEVVLSINLESRLAQRVLVELIEGGYRHEDDLYALARKVDWTRWIGPSETIKIDTTAQRSPLRSLNFATLRIKDAICDTIRDATGERPSVDTREPDLPVVLHLSEERAALYVDTSGAPLFKRGWRLDKGDAPLKETLAAAMLAAAGWQGTAETGGALHDPCCGSGTIPIEAAQIACGIAPGLQRRFAFERQKPFAALRARWAEMKQAAKERIHAPAVPIYASDVAFRMVDFARRNAERAGVAQYIQFNGGDALERPAPKLPAGLGGTLMMNPPYGERIEVRGKAAAVRDASGSEQRDADDDFFPRLASHWKHGYTSNEAGWTAWMLSPDMKLPNKMRLKESRRFPMWNGPIECRLFRFDLVKGSAREKRAEAS
ncbi:THUMP domain-containing protein [Pelomonas sp. SE-A7]|uniref:THUMP domain-containing class I SAM-dependent RNA methyltransferase n=1 Tax=Pelomonas sp. SE-A7 TaxID=3054953 RepID=UPI00259CBCBF|nr:THUMP domain-containing protein [Pelomonas sp. SE-A7]MDM4766996.1 THUMP domain-containing protein [Pelomonas sp. SE-A7]